MATNREGRIFLRHFSALARVTSQITAGLAWILRAILTEQARGQVRRLGLPPLTDSSGGTSAGEVGEVTVPAVTDTSSSGGATASSCNTAFGTVANAYATLITRLNLLRC